MFTWLLFDLVQSQTDTLGPYVGEVESIPQLVGIFHAFEAGSIDDRLQARDAVSCETVRCVFVDC
jgi:hypothetical protein